MYQISTIRYRFTFLFALVICVLAFLSQDASAQTKSLETAQAEAAQTPGISVAYDETRYLTIASIVVDPLPSNEILGKQFKKFEWTLESWFSIKGIDRKPARVVLCLATQSKRFAFTSDRKLALSFDGEDVLLGEAQRKSEVKGGKARENLCWEVDDVITEDFAKASSVFFAIGRTGGAFPAASLAKFKSYKGIVSLE